MRGIRTVLELMMVQLTKRTPYGSSLALTREIVTGEYVAGAVAGDSAGIGGIGGGVEM